MDGQPGEAVRTFSAVLEAHPNDDAARINEAVALDMLKRHAEAQDLYRAALAKNPTDPEAVNDMALSLLLSGQPMAAKAVLAPFRGNADLPERMRSTMASVDAALAAPAAPAPPPVPETKKASPASGPTSLKPPSRQKVKGVLGARSSAPHGTSDQTTAR